MSIFFKAIIKRKQLLCDYSELILLFLALFLLYQTTKNMQLYLTFDILTTFNLKKKENIVNISLLKSDMLKLFADYIYENKICPKSKCSNCLKTCDRTIGKQCCLYKLLAFYFLHQNIFYPFKYKSESYLSVICKQWQYEQILTS